MILYYVALLMTVLSNVLYHLIQKSTPNNVNPILSVFFTYATAAILCLVMYPFFRGSDSLSEAVRKLNWTSFALGAAIIGLETGFMLAYRTGWDLGKANLISSTSVTLVLIPIGLIMFHEKISLVNAAGMILCLIGVVLANYK